MVLEKTLERPLDCKEIDLPVNPKGNQSWIFTGRTDDRVGSPILRLHDAKSQLIGKDPDAGKNWRQEEKTEDERAGRHHGLNGHEFEQALKDGEGQRSLTCYSPWGQIELDMIEGVSTATTITSLFLPLPSFGNHYSTLCFYKFSCLRSTYKWDHMGFINVFLCLAYFT